MNEEADKRMALIGVRALAAGLAVSCKKGCINVMQLHGMLIGRSYGQSEKRPPTARNRKLNARSPVRDGLPRCPVSEKSGCTDGYGDDMRQPKG